MDTDGQVKIRWWNFLASLICKLDKDIFIYDELVIKCITVHIDNINYLNIFQLFEFMQMIVKNKQVVSMLNGGKVHP